MSDLVSGEYAALLASVKARVRAAQYAALRSVNLELVALYRDIGREIAERQVFQRNGSAVVAQLSQELQSEFPGVSGFSVRNLFYMRDIYRAYPDGSKMQPLVAEIGWTHNLIILERCKDDLEREFYLRMTRKFGWTKNVLIHPAGRAGMTQWRETVKSAATRKAAAPEIG